MSKSLAAVAPSLASVALSLASTFHFRRQLLFHCCWHHLSHLCHCLCCSHHLSHHHHHLSHHCHCLSHHHHHLSHHHHHLSHCQGMSLGTLYLVYVFRPLIYSLFPPYSPITSCTYIALDSCWSSHLPIRMFT